MEVSSELRDAKKRVSVKYLGLVESLVRNVVEHGAASLEAAGAKTRLIEEIAALEESRRALIHFKTALAALEDIS